MEAGGLIEEVLDVGHKVEWTSLFDLQGFLLVLEEEVKELFLDWVPVFLHKIVYIKLVVDLQNMFKVFSPPTTVVVGHQPSRVPEGRPFPAPPLRLGSLWRWWRRWWWEAPPTRHQPRGQTTLLMLSLCTHHLWCTSWVTNGVSAMSPPSHCRPSVSALCHPWGWFYLWGCQLPAPWVFLAVAPLVGMAWQAALSVAVRQASSGARTALAWVALAFAGPVCLGGVTL